MVPPRVGVELLPVVDERLNEAPLAVGFEFPHPCLVDLNQLVNEAEVVTLLDNYVGATFSPPP